MRRSSVISSFLSGATFSLDCAALQCNKPSFVISGGKKTIGVSFCLLREATQRTSGEKAQQSLQFAKCPGCE